MSHEPSDSAPRFSLPVKQGRSQKTRDRLLAAGFKLLRRKDFDQLSVADIARAAGCAVGSFYQRFFDKDQYFNALAVMRRMQSRSQLDSWYANVTLASPTPNATHVNAVSSTDDLRDSGLIVSREVTTRYDVIKAAGMFVAGAIPRTADRVVPATHISSMAYTKTMPLVRCSFAPFAEQSAT